ncbi:MAG: PhoH family protein [Candidatus Njordarchaeales archaeon]
MKEDEKLSESSNKSIRYIIDTNVIINDPNIIDKLKGEVIIPTTVLQELDKHKYGDSEKARNIRVFARFLEKKKDNVSFYSSHQLDGESNDEKIVKTAEKYSAKHKVILITDDIFMSVWARSKGITTVKHDNLKVEDSSYSGILNIKNKEDEDSLIKHPNQYILKENGLYKWKDDKYTRLNKDKKIWGIGHKNVEQKCALDALLDDKIKLVTLSGRAGSGKSLLTIVAGLEKVIKESKYQRLLISRPIVPMGNDIGFLPGDIKEKLSPWMQPIFDNMDFIFSRKDKNANDVWIGLESDGLLKLEALSYVRGRSIANQFIIIDEAQNLTKHEVKTIISRVGDNTKIVMTGDPQQIDNVKLDSCNNGLSYVIEKFKTQPIAAHITLTKCERSELADIASEIL